MSEEILVNVTPPETRVAVIENGVVQEIIIERTQRRGLVGNIYKGKICRVLPGMQAAFVDIGLERAAFLHASDISNGNAVSSESINELVREGAEVIVQVVKDPLGTKGARLTTHISIPSRYLVFMPELTNLGISQKIEDENERTRLRDIVSGFFGDSSLKGNFIIRTAAESVDEETLKSDIRFLTRLWHAIQDRLQTSPVKQLIHEDLPLYLRSLRDLITDDVERLRIDSRENWQRLSQFAEKLIPDSPVKIEYYPGERPIFDLYGVEDEIQKALEQKVTLKSGGYLIIDQTEAMTTIDVNTGAFVGHRNQEETIFKTNMEAAQAICRQLRLRNLGGIIIIDFIDMMEEEHKRQVLRALEKCLARDHAKTHITEVSSLGLVEMTRKRTRESLEHILCEPCPCCGGRGSLKTAETTCYEIFREILREARQFDVESLLVLASQEVVDRLLDEESATLAELGSFIGKNIRLQAESLYTQEHYDVVLI
ncbi:ribonuclease G [Sedimenticola selenatireducens]|uniref:Ribonuclease G n=1 Tax=Sedimenticola selenatireducens TaxID=191960 RepID=A0A557SHY8_9GAMM|nr:ribonuclease G [Sedimenticola selenatireducens]TVO77033.1 ribonuclease G [Sedimenticola selenatireducens]TVT64475.1 MAG: ribonuclease G [Sedimenticola selenatireducens]